MAKKPSPKTKPAAAKKPVAKKPAGQTATPSSSKRTSPKKPAHASASKPLKASPAKKNPAKRKSKEPAVLSVKPAKTKSAKAKPTATKTTQQSPGTYFARVTHWPQDVFAGLGRMIQKAAPAKDAAAESLGWLKSRASRVKEVGQKELREFVRVASKLKELRRAPAPAETTGKRKTKHK